MNTLDPTNPEMDRGDYLWDRNGPVDPEVARLESLLARYRHRGELTLPHAAYPIRETTDARPTAHGLRLRPRAFAGPLAAAAMVALASLAAWLAARPTASWPVESLGGAPTIASRAMQGSDRLPIGRWLVTDGSSRARVGVDDLGEVSVEPGSRLRIKPAPSGRRLMELREGTIRASIVAPPRIFLVDTPAARAIDMGCEYTLSVDEHGTGELVVELGYVMLEGFGRSSMVPMNGGACLIRAGHGPGTPYFRDAASGFLDALRRFDFESGGSAALGMVLEEARPRDALTLWHLLSRTSGDDRLRTYERLAALKPPPPGLHRRAILALDPAALEWWWNDMRPF